MSNYNFLFGNQLSDYICHITHAYNYTCIKRAWTSMPKSRALYCCGDHNFIIHTTMCMYLVSIHAALSIGFSSYLTVCSMIIASCRIDASPPKSCECVFYANGSRVRARWSKGRVAGHELPASVAMGLTAMYEFAVVGFLVWRLSPFPSSPKRKIFVACVMPRAIRGKLCVWIGGGLFCMTESGYYLKDASCRRPW